MVEVSVQPFSEVSESEPAFWAKLELSEENIPLKKLQIYVTQNNNKET